MIARTRVPPSATDALQVAHLRTLVDLGRRALAGEPLPDLLAFATAEVAGHLDVPRVGIFERLRGEPPTLLLRAGAGWRSDELGRLRVPEGPPASFGPDPFFLGGPDPGGGMMPDPLLALGILRSVGVGIAVGGAPYGVIAAFADDATGSFGTVEAVLLSEVAEMLGAILTATEQREAREQDSRRRQTLELNDTVVQGLTTIAYALECNRTDLGLDAAHETLRAVRAMIHDLMLDSPDVPVQPGSLRRAQPVASSLRPEAVDGRVGRMPIRVVIADDAEDMRILLRMALEEHGGFSVVGEASDGVEAIDVVAATQPDVVLLDLAMPRLDGLEAAKVIRKRVPATKIVVLSGFEVERMGPGGAAEHGVDLYVEKGAALHSIAASIRSLVAAEGVARG